jgi:hypothetical protein
MVRRHKRLRRTQVPKRRRSLVISARSAEAIATSAHCAPIATSTAPARKAKESLMPSAFGLMAHASAQTEPPAAAPSSELNEIVVTGSLLRRTSEESESPVTIFTAAEIKQTGLSSVLTWCAPSLPTTAARSPLHSAQDSRQRVPPLGAMATTSVLLDVTPTT